MDIIKLKWYKDNDKHYTGFEDGGAWGWVYLGLDDTWWWETDCTEDGITQYTSGFATAEDAKSAADAAYGKWVESLGDPLEDMPVIDVDFPETPEADILSVFDVSEDEE